MKIYTLAFVLVAAGAAAACHRTEAAADSGAISAASATASVDMVAAVAPMTDDSAGVTIAPPAALVQADSNIPLNEAVVGTPANIPAN